MSTKPRRKALLVGIDGCNLPRIDNVAAPTLRRLRDHGYHASSSVYPTPPDGGEPVTTVSGPGWSTILTGTWPWTHGVLDNTITGHRLEEHPDLISRATAAGLSTFYSATWKPLYDEILTRQVTDRVVIDQDHWPEYELTVAGSTVHAITQGVDLAFAYFGSPDQAAHRAGATSAAYDQAIENVDRHLSALLRTVEARTGEDWMVLVTTDHGHRPEGGHGGQTPAERASFVLGSGGGLPTGTAPAESPPEFRMVDIAPTLLAHLGVAPAAVAAGPAAGASAGFDGVPRNGG